MVNIIELLKYELQLFKVLGHHIVTRKECPSVNYEIVLLLIKEIIFIKIVVIFVLTLISNDECHEAVRKTDKLIEENPVMIFMIKSIPFIEVKVNVVISKLRNFGDFICCYSNILVAYENFIIFCDICTSISSKEYFRLLANIN